MRVISLIFLTLVAVCGCAGTGIGPKYSEVASAISAPEPGSSRLIIFRNWYWYAGGLDARIRINGRKVLSLPTDTFSYIDVAPGRNEISVDTWGEKGPFIISVKLKKDREYYFAIGSGVDMGLVIAANIWTQGTVDKDDIAVKEVETVVIENPNALMIVPVTKKDAMEKLPAMRLAQPSSP